MGGPISIAEQVTRFATIMAAFDTVNNPTGRLVAQQVFGSDERFNAQNLI
jgi:hypothetical protein